MDTLFLFCAVVGGSVMLFQFALTFLGLGDSGGELGDVGDIGDIDDVNVDDTAGFSDAVDTEAAGSVSSHIFGVLSFRTVIAAVTFFGIAGKAALAAELSVVQALPIAVAAGAAAMYGVYSLMRAIYRLRSAGNVRIGGAVGLRGVVYVPIPAGRSGAGKIQLNLQNRTMEYQAMTDGEAKLPTGARIVVTDVLGPDTVAVARIPDAVDAPAEL